MMKFTRIRVHFTLNVTHLQFLIPVFRLFVIPLLRPLLNKYLIGGDGGEQSFDNITFGTIAKRQNKCTVLYSGASFQHFCLSK